MANGAGARNGAALVALAVLLAASMLAVGADAGRWSHRHHHHRRGRDRGDHSPPAPPGFDQPEAAPSPPYIGDGPAASPFTQSWSYDGSEGPVAAASPSLAPGPPLPCDGAPEAAPSLESGLY